MSTRCKLSDISVRDMAIHSYLQPGLKHRNRVHRLISRPDLSTIALYFFLAPHLSYLANGVDPDHLAC